MPGTDGPQLELIDLSSLVDGATRLPERIEASPTPSPAARLVLECLLATRGPFPPTGLLADTCKRNGFSGDETAAAFRQLREMVVEIDYGDDGHGRVYQRLCLVDAMDDPGAAGFETRWNDVGVPALRALGGRP